MRSVVVVIVGILAIMACGGSGPTPEETANEVSRQWTRDSIDDVAEYAAERVTGEIPVASQLAGGWLAGQINERIEWEYAEPRCEEPNRCDVTVTASAAVDVDIPFVLTDTITVTVPFVLRVDVDSKSVMDWNPNVLGTRVTR